MTVEQSGQYLCTNMDKKLDDTQKEWEQIVVKQGEHIKKLAEQNKAQDVIINKLNAEYNLKGKKK